MADCCSPASGFPTAPQLGQIATNLPVIWEEICKIQQALLEAASPCQPGGGQFCTVIGGDTPMTFVTGISEITVVNGGLGYFVDTPFVKFIPPLGSSAVGAEATILTNGSSILSITVTAGGSGYLPIPATLTVSSLAGTGAILEPLVNASGKIVGVNIVSPGVDYTVDDTIVAHRAVEANPFYMDAEFKITGIGVLGEITSIQVKKSGSGYQPSVTTIQIASSIDQSKPYPSGSGFFGTVATDALGAVTNVMVNNGGAGYTDFSPYLVISDPGTGAQTLVHLTDTSVSSVDIIKQGNNYTPAALAEVFNPPSAPLPNPPAIPAIVTLEVKENPYGTNPNLYYQVWAGTITNKAISQQLNAVMTYFKGLGYTVTLQTNPETGNTLQWHICW